MRTTTRAYSSSGWEETLSVSTEDASGQGTVSKVIDGTLIFAGVDRGESAWIFTWIFAVVQAEAERLGEGHTHGLPQRWPQEGGQA